MNEENIKLVHYILRELGKSRKKLDDITDTFELLVLPSDQMREYLNLFCDSFVELSCDLSYMSGRFSSLKSWLNRELEEQSSEPDK